MTHIPSIAIIIVTWNKEQYVVDLLASLDMLHYPSEKIKIVVVDNASTDSTVDTLTRKYGDSIHLIVNPDNLGGCGGFNTGLAWAFDQLDGEYEYLWLLDNDVQVHQDALIEMVNILESNADIAVAGSTMMQLSKPWKINEMGAFVDRGSGRLLFNRHLEEVDSWKGNTLEDLLGKPLDLSREVESCNAWMDVEYVAAASMLVRAKVAKEAGLWEDFFIHFDDVEWCLRIAGLGHRIAVSAKSLIWHLPWDHKIPTWVLYYDNRNILYLLEKHSDPGSIQRTRRLGLKKSLYYTLLGKSDLGNLLVEAIEDFDQRVTGKKEIQLDPCYTSLDEVTTLLADTTINRVLLSWGVNLQDTNLQGTVVQAMKKRPELQIHYLCPAPGVAEKRQQQLPGAMPVASPKNTLKRMRALLRLRGRYDLVIQSDHQQMLPLSLLGCQILFVNYEGCSLRSSPTIRTVATHVRRIMKLY